ncbi:hypothetical protein Trco_006518 [Trichoderma cornu-damae]|uniref:VOC domain-containing protein n=1 Tax=Trichoderma cornu-damae TaxID=654480 RepID=A0A9P8QFB6_9HYPO|nr:hypothetical protein Trco_006518 [Trichoderma cornu-damae]
MSSTEECYGQICWLTLPVVDIDRAKAFYANIFSWETNPSNVPNSQPSVKEVYFFNRGKSLNGTFYVMEDGFHATNHSAGSQDAISLHPSFNVKNCEETLAEVEKLGGKTHLSKTEIGGDMGFYARFIDTEGNLIGIWSKT